MRATQSSNASGMYSGIGTSIAIVPSPPPRDRMVNPLPIREPAGVPMGVAQGEGLLHDARNLVGALGLYCDLLALPGVLKPEHMHYADELRLLGSRSAALMERLMVSSLAKTSIPAKANSGLWDEEPRSAAEGRYTPQSITVRGVVERCLGLMGRVSGGRAIQVEYGAAAPVLVRVEQEDIERILVNLVRNSATAMAHRDMSVPIRIVVGSLVNRVGEARPWPLRRVRLTVEDSGRGITPEELERMLRPGRGTVRGSRGIGFRVVQELVASSGGDLRVVSSRGVGTRVQIEWPMAVEGECHESGRGEIESGIAAVSVRRPR